MTLDWQVVVIAILAVLLRVCVLLAKPNSEEFEGSGGSPKLFQQARNR
jgi:preprotein translocase subunit SecG